MKRLLLIFLRTALSSSSVVQGEEIHRVDKCIIHDDQPASAAFSDIAFRFANLQMCNRRSDMYCLPTCIETNKSQGCIAQCVASNLLTQILPTSSICLVAHHAKALKQKGSYATIGLTIPCIALRWHTSVLPLSIDPLILIPHGKSAWLATPLTLVTVSHSAFVKWVLKYFPNLETTSERTLKKLNGIPLEGKRKVAPARMYSSRSGALACCCQAACLGMKAAGTGWQQHFQPEHY